MRVSSNNGELKITFLIPPPNDDQLSHAAKHSARGNIVGCLEAARQ